MGRISAYREGVSLPNKILKGHFKIPEFILYFGEALTEKNLLERREERKGKTKGKREKKGGKRREKRKSL